MPGFPKINSSNINELLLKYSDLIFAVFVLSAVGMIMIPMPTWLLDILLTLSITVGVVILLVSLYISEALKIASFPTILLIATLYRLALNISSTREFPYISRHRFMFGIKLL